MIFINKEVIWKNTLWVEKHRPKTLDTYIGNEQLKDKVKHYLDSGDLPHLYYLVKVRPQ